MAIRFEEVDLTPEGLDLFLEMAAAYTAAEVGEDRDFMLTKSAAGGSLNFLGTPRAGWQKVEEAQLRDMASFGLLRRARLGRHSVTYELTPGGRRYYQWLQQQRGQPVDQVEGAVARWLDGERFASRYPRASVSLGRAFAAIWSGDQGEQTVSSMGADLRSALQDFTDELLQRLGVESSTSAEKPLERLAEAVEAVGDRVGPRETAVLKQLVELSRVTWRQTQRLTHVRDEDEPVAGWDELRRSGFILAVVVHELDRATG